MTRRRSLTVFCAALILGSGLALAASLSRNPVLYDSGAIYDGYGYVVLATSSETVVETAIYKDLDQSGFYTDREEIVWSKLSRLLRMTPPPGSEGYVFKSPGKIRR